VSGFTVVFNIPTSAPSEQRNGVIWSCKLNLASPLHQVTANLHTSVPSNVCCSTVAVVRNGER
jgi:hypothetical protein